MAKTIKVNPVTMVMRTQRLSGSAATLTENAPPTIEDIEGMPAAVAAVAQINELQKALEAYQGLIRRDAGQIQKAVMNFVTVDQAQK